MPQKATITYLTWWRPASARKSTDTSYSMLLLVTACICSLSDTAEVWVSSAILSMSIYLTLPLFPCKALSGTSARGVEPTDQDQVKSADVICVGQAKPRSKALSPSSQSSSCIKINPCNLRANEKDQARRLHIPRGVTIWRGYGARACLSLVSYRDAI